ncbi:uncharacterized protein ACRADG_008592 [Cochliomyia hominivorax]
MKTLLVLSVLLAVVCAAPQYGYQEPEHLGSGPAGAFSGLSTAGIHPASQGHGGEKYLPPTPTTAAPIIRKQFYVISAPEDEGSQPKHKHLVLGRPQKNYRVVFIKAPNPGAANVKYSAEFAPQEEKTVIYVLSKKDNELDASDIATPAPTAASKPEVFFIKYKTEEEAQHAQREIQGEYDKLGGTNEVADETTAPITSVIGSLDSLNPDGSYNYRPQSKNVGQASGKHPVAQAPTAQYLPSLFKH